MQTGLIHSWGGLVRGCFGICRSVQRGLPQTTREDCHTSTLLLARLSTKRITAKAY